MDSYDEWMNNYLSALFPRPTYEEYIEALWEDTYDYIDSFITTDD